MKAKVVSKRIMMNRREIIRYQLITYCFINNIKISESELSCLALLGDYGKYELADFCSSAVTEGIFKTPQTVRNFLTKAEKTRIIIKTGKTRKMIELNEDLQIQTKGNIVLDYKIAHVSAEES